MCRLVELPQILFFLGGDGGWGWGGVVVITYTHWLHKEKLQKMCNNSSVVTNTPEDTQQLLSRSCSTITVSRCVFVDNQSRLLTQKGLAATRATVKPDPACKG